MWPRDVNDVTHRKRGLIFEKSELVESCRPKKMGDFRLLAEALWRLPHVVWGRWKSQHRKIVSLSLCRKIFKLKGNKSFVPELRSRKCFCVSGFLCYLYGVMNILCIFHVFMYGHVTPGPCWRIEKIVEPESDGDTNCKWCFCYSH